MNFASLERRNDPRTQAYVSISLRYDNAEDDTPAHMVDLSRSGAALLTTTQNAPRLGQYLRVRFEAPETEGAKKKQHREELAIVVNMRRPERGVSRVGVRFLHPIDSGNSIYSPKDLLTDQRKFSKDKSAFTDDRWSFLKNVSDKQALAASNN